MGDANLLPREAHLNTCGVAVQQFLHATKLAHGAEMELTKNLPLGSGMGSRCCEPVAALVAINHATGNKLSRKDLLPFAVKLNEWPVAQPMPIMLRRANGWFCTDP